MLSARVRDQLRGTLDLWSKVQGITARLQAASSQLKFGFGISLAIYLLLKLVGVVVHLPSAVDLAVLPVGVCALGLAVSSRRVRAQEETVAAKQADEAIRPGLMAGAVLVVFTLVYLAVNTVPMITAQDESAIVLGGHSLATTGSLRVTSPLNDRYHTNIIGALHVLYRTPTEMYYRTFPGTAVLYAPFSVLPHDVGYRLFAAVFGTVTVVALYFVAWKLLRSWWGALAAAVVFAASPAFGHWAVTVFNNVPVLALELCAVAIVLWAPPDRAWRYGAAGALLSLACFARLTEIVFVLPVFLLVLWHTRAPRPLLTFAGGSLVSVALIAITNEIFYGDPLFVPQVGSWYIPIAAASQPASSQVLLQHYAQFSTGTDAISGVSLLAKLNHVWFHVRYLASSTFAFPFLPIAFVGLAWRVAARKRDIWLLIGAILTVTLAVLAIYGQRYNNYYGFGQPIVRSSFVRYSLPIYALLAVAAGAFFVDARHVVRGGLTATVLPVALIAIITTIGVAHSYDWSVYGFNRLNTYRDDDRAAWSGIEAFLDTDQVRPLVIGGPSAEKLIDAKYEPYFINYDSIPALFRIPVLLPVAQQAARERDVYLITGSNQNDSQLLLSFYARYRPQEVLDVGEFRLYRLRFDPANYALGFVDVWSTYDAINRWAVTDSGLLMSKAGNSYVDLLPAMDSDHDGRVDQDVTVQFEVLDSGPSSISISALDSRQSGQPVTLVSEKLAQTGAWRTFTFTLKKGEYLQNLLVVSPGVTIRSIAIVAVGGS